MRYPYTLVNRTHLANCVVAYAWKLFDMRAEPKSSEHRNGESMMAIAK